jgi:hypothetical protein
MMPRSQIHKKFSEKLSQVACWMGAYHLEKLDDHVIDFGKLLDSISRSHEEVQ